MINDHDNDKALYQYSSEGKIIKKFGGLGKDSQDYKFFFPVALSMGPGGSIYISDMGLYSVQKFTLDGKRGVYITGRAKDDTKIYEPKFVTLDKKGTIYVTGPGGKIHRFDSSGQHLGEWGAKGSEEGQYRDLGHYALDQDGNFLILDSDKARLLKYDADGKFLKEWEVNRFSHGIVVDGAGKIFTFGAFHIQKFDAEGTLISELEIDEDHPSIRPTSMVGLSSGALVLDADNSRVLKIE